MVEQSGNINDFAIDGDKHENFPKLPKPSSYHWYQWYNYFGVYHDNSIYYLSCNPNIDVTKQTLVSGKMYHRKIMNSKIPNRHISGTVRTVEGLRVGNYFWIMGSETDSEDFSNANEVNGKLGFSGGDLSHLETGPKKPGQDQNLTINKKIYNF